MWLLDSPSNADPLLPLPCVGRVWCRNRAPPHGDRHANHDRSALEHTGVTGDRYERLQSLLSALTDHPENRVVIAAKSPNRLVLLAAHQKFHPVPIRLIEVAYPDFPDQNAQGRLITVEREREFQRRYVFLPPSQPTVREPLAPDRWLRLLTPAHVGTGEQNF